MMDALTAIELWKSNDDWKFADKEAAWKFMFQMGQESARQPIYEAEAEQLTRPLREKVSILRDSAKDVIDWCDKTESGDSLYCITRLRHAIAATEPT